VDGFDVPGMARKMDAVSGPESDPEPDNTLGTKPGTPRRVMFLVTEDWYFCSHRLPVARALKAAGYEVAVACRVNKAGKKITDEGFTLFPLALSRRSLNPFHLIAAIWRIRRTYKSFRPDVVHHVALKPAVLGAIAARYAGVPHMISAIAGLGYVFSSRRLKAQILRPLLTLLLRRLLGGPGNHVIVQNDDDGRALIARGIIQPTQLTVIRGSGVDPNRFHPTPEPSGPVRAVMVSRMIREKGVTEMVAAARILKRRGLNICITLAGQPDRENPSAISNAELAAWHTEGIVEYLGQVDDVPALWAASHIAVLPSYYGEGVPLSLIEAAACGRPLIAADGPGLRDITRPDETGILVPPRDAQALADAIGRLANDAELRARLGAGARHLAETNFSIAQVQAATLEVYRQLMSAP
jgi:glycosyltransferase involved in cell wall biosynthesis